jgi:hypothetical protein
MKTAKGNKQINAAKKEREQQILRTIDKNGLWYPNRVGVTSIAGYNAMDRLVQAGRITYDTLVGGYVRTQAPTK